MPNRSVASPEPNRDQVNREARAALAFAADPPSRPHRTRADGAVVPGTLHPLGLNHRTSHRDPHRNGASVPTSSPAGISLVPGDPALGRQLPRGAPDPVWSRSTRSKAPGRGRCTPPNGQIISHGEFPRPRASATARTNAAKLLRRSPFFRGLREAEVPGRGSGGGGAAGIGARARGCSGVDVTGRCALGGVFPPNCS